MVARVVEPERIESLLHSLEATLDETAQEIACVIEEQLLEYRALRGETENADWRAGLRWSLGRFVRLQRRASPELHEDELRTIEAMGARQAQRGIRLASVLGSARLAMFAAFRVVKGLARELDGDDADELVDWVTLRMTCFVNDFSDAVSRGYANRQSELVVHEGRERARLFVDLLSGAFSSYAELEQRAEGMGASVAGRLGVLLVPSQHRGGSSPFVEEVRGLVRDAVIVPMVSASSPHAVLLVPVRAENEWESLLGRLRDSAERNRTSVFSVGACDVPLELYERYATTSPLLAVAPARLEDEWLMPVERLIPPYLVENSPPPVATAVRRLVLEPLRRRPRMPLLDALDAFLVVGMSPKAAARLLGVSETTMRGYRAAIEEATGLCFDRPVDLLWLTFAALLERQRARTPPAGGPSVSARLRF